ncbi:MAG: hypothetical protein AMXMBFR7_03860 [Planctomycetota bacterium]
MTRACIAFGLGVLLVLAWPLNPQAHESPVDHVTRTVRMWIADGNLELTYEMQLSERAALMELHGMDRSGNGAIEPAERKAWFEAQAKRLAGQLKGELAGAELEFAPVGDVALKPDFRQLYRFRAKTRPLAFGTHKGRLLDHFSRSYPGVYRWQPTQAQTGADLRVLEEPKVDGEDGHPGMVVLAFEVVVRGAP